MPQETFTTPSLHVLAPAFAGKHSGCSLHVVTALSGVPHCSDSHVLPTWDRWS